MSLVKKEKKTFLFFILALNLLLRFKNKKLIFRAKSFKSYDLVFSTKCFMSVLLIICHLWQG